MIDENELFEIKGGATSGASIINSIIKVVTTALELGRTIGTAIRRKLDKKTC